MHERTPLKENANPHQLELFSLGDDQEQLDHVSYEILDTPDLRYQYVRYTEGVIARAIAEDIDTMVFLDKSARPVAWLMKSLWPTLGIKDFDADGQPIRAAMPAIKFINFDREQWAPAMGRSEGRDGNGITLDGVHPDTVDSLTGLFAIRAVDRDEYISSDEKTLFDDKNVLIVDEVSASGDTLTMAQALLGRAFTNAHSIQGMHWMSPDKTYDKKSGGVRNADLPVWYSADTPYGRIVGDRDLYKSGQSSSMRQRRGAQFLSYRLPKLDAQGRRLRAEMAQLGRDVADGKMPVLLDATYRPNDDVFVDQYMQHVNDISTAEFAVLRQQAVRERVSFPDLLNEYKQARG